MMSQRKRLDREAFIHSIKSQFPEVVATIDESDDGLLHLEGATYSRCVENAMDEGRFWDVDRYCRFIAASVANADDALDNAIGVSFIEDFALGEITELRCKAVRERMLRKTRDEIVAIDDRWR